MKLYEQGQPDQGLIDLIAANVRLPDMTLGDMYAQAASLRLGERRFQELCDKYGLDVDFDELGRHASRIFERVLLGAGAELEGPAVIEEPAASTVVFPGQRLRVDELGNLIVQLQVAS